MDIRYVAGLFDGEGYVRIDPFKPKDRDFPRYQVLAGVGMTHQPIIMALQRQFNGYVATESFKTGKMPAARNMWRWRVASRSAYAFLIQIRQHLIVKREEAELAIHLQEHVFEHNSAMRHMPHAAKCAIFEYRQSIHDQMRRLKKVEFPIVDSDPMLAA